ncbi:MAG: ATP-dependent Clp protease proteolytic subunit [Planctomycetota bacterium]
MPSTTPTDLARIPTFPGADRPAELSPAWPLAAAHAPRPHGAPHLDPRLSPAAAPPAYQRYREMTIDEMLLENRVIFLVGEINHVSAMNVVMRLLYLQNQKPGQDINFYINSPGGAVDDTLAMIDTMQFISSEVATYCIGKAMSGGALTLAAGQPGKRYCLPHAKVMIHQPYGGIYGQTTDVQIQAEEILKTKDELNEMLAKFTGKPVEQVAEDSERDKFFSAQEAKDYGLVDEVVTAAPESEKKD